MDQRTLSKLLQRVAAGDTTVEQAVDDLRHLPYDALGDSLIDTHRELRTGQAEAVYGPGKSPEQVRDAVASLIAYPGGAIFVTRASKEQFEAARDAAPEASWDERSRLVVARRASSAADTGDADPGEVAVVSAGTSDLPVADEAAQTADALGIGVVRVTDVGVAGLHRLLDARSDFSDADCVIVVAGMEGALPSVVTGLVAAPVVAVPTSVGYGAALEGVTALLAMLTSCAPGVSVVNIDNGFGAAQVAHRIVRGSR
ncbi:MAG: nickel pincer cofactor biosynthesis protein LarB [Actinomycetota bacterium]